MLNNLLKDLTAQIYKYNDFLDKKALSKADINEEDGNLKDILEIEKRLKDLLTKLKKMPAGKDISKDNEDLMELHVLLDNLSWYFQNIHEKLMAVFKNYPQ